MQTDFTHNTAAHKKLIREYLQATFGFEIPPPGDKDYARTSRRRYSDYINADMVAEEMATQLKSRAERDGLHFKAVPEGWTVIDSHNHAKIAFYIARVCALKRMEFPDEVVASYVQSVSESDAPRFFDQMPEFFHDVFTSRNGEAVTGSEIIARAMKDKERYETSRAQKPGGNAR